MSAFDKEITMCIKKEEIDVVPKEPGSVVQVYQTTLKVKEEMEDDGNQESHEEPLYTEDPGLHIKQDPELDLDVDGSEHNLVPASHQTCSHEGNGAPRVNRGRPATSFCCARESRRLVNARRELTALVRLATFVEPCSAMTTKEDILRLLADGQYVLLDKTRTSHSSSCWDNFKIVAERETNNPVGYVQCQRRCKALLLYKGSTTGMKRHSCSRISHSVCTTVANDDKETIRDRCVKMCTLDLWPFNFVSGEGFIDLAQGLIDIGAKYGAVEAEKILPSPRTLSRHIQDMANEVRSEILPQVKKAIDQSECAMMCDLWTDNYHKIHYLTVASSIIADFEDRCELRNNLLLTTKLPEVSQTSENIVTELYEKLCEINISPRELAKVTFVTDQGTNIKKALENHNHLPCAVDLINTALRQTFDETFLSEELPDICISIQVVRKTVRYMKRSGLVARLGKTLHQEVEGRWNSMYMMLESFHSQKNEIENLLFEKNKHEMIASYQVDIMEGIIKFLEHFKEATNDLESEKEPTLPFVVPWAFSLLDTCQSKNENAVVKLLKKRAGKFLKEKVISELQDSHYIATVLHPNFKELLVLTEEKRENVYETVRQKLTNVIVEEGLEEPIPSPVKKFRAWRSSNPKRKGEFDKYLNMDSPGDNFRNILSWWKANACTLPKLYKLARETLCIPASSAASQRNFSRAGLIVTEKRYSIDPDHVNDILFIHNYKRDK